MAIKTETQINEFKINYLTEAQYEEALVAGEINDDEIYMTPSSESDSTDAEVVEVTLESLGITATVSELNKLDGVTATTTELNYVDGVTSNIQTQLNNKASSSHTHSEYAEAEHTHNEYMNSTDPVGTGSFSMNRKADTTVGNYSIAMGYNCEVKNAYATAFGANCTVSGNYAVACGEQCTASAARALASNYKTTASGSYAVAQGKETTASGVASVAQGAGTTASGNYSYAGGYYTTALANQFVIGHYNGSSNETTGSNSGTTGTAFVIGNGASTTSNSSNAFRIDYNGAAYGLSAYNSSGADMAEFREWLDGNPDNEDRRGYFVTMDGMNIKIAEPGDYICGVISANPCLVGNGDEDWQGRYILDEFGAYIYEEKEEIDPATGETVINKFYKVNPDYDPTQAYIQRKDRPEWDYVGLCGVINTRDDGTCEVNGFCKCGDGGIATKSEKGYRVLERVNDNVIKILFFLTGEVF